MKNVVLLTVMLLLSIIGFSQTENSITKKVKFGFNIGANYSNLQSKKILPSNAKISNGVGFKIGVFYDYHLSNNFLISPKSELSFNNSNVIFSNTDNSETTYDIFPTSLDIMTHLVYKIGDSKMIPYFLIGPNLKCPISKKSDSTSDFKTNPDFAIDFGIGFENKTKHFIFAPELRYSLGLLNVNENPALQILNYHNISLVLSLK